jgi:hypothetical protein
MLAMYKRSSLIQKLVNYGEKQFYNIGPRTAGANPTAPSLTSPTSTRPGTLAELKYDKVAILSNFFPLSLMTRFSKLEHFSLETLSNQVLKFEGKARANPIGAPFLGKLLVLQANVRLDWKGIARYKHSNLFGLNVSDEGKKIL